MVYMAVVSCANYQKPEDPSFRNRKNSRLVIIIRYYLFKEVKLANVTELIASGTCIYFTVCLLELIAESCNIPEI